MLRAQKRLQQAADRRVRKEELAVMSWVKPRRGTPAWEALKQEIINYHTKDTET